MRYRRRQAPTRRILPLVMYLAHPGNFWHNSPDSFPGKCPLDPRHRTLWR